MLFHCQDFLYNFENNNKAGLQKQNHELQTIGMYFEAVAIDSWTALKVEHHNSMHFRLKCLYNPCDCMSGHSSTRWKQKYGQTKCVNQCGIEKRHYRSAWRIDAHHSKSTFASPVDPCTAELWSNNGTACRFQEEQIVMISPSTIQALLCRPACIYSNTELIRKKIMSFDSITCNRNTGMLLIGSLTATTYCLLVRTWQHAVRGPRGGRQWRLKVLDWNCQALQ